MKNITIFLAATTTFLSATAMNFDRQAGLAQHAVLNLAIIAIQSQSGVNSTVPQQKPSFAKQKKYQ